MEIGENQERHLPHFVRLNEEWISRYFAIEDADRALAANPHGRDYADVLMQTCLNKLSVIEATRVYLVSNTKLTAAIALYRKHGFRTIAEGPHPLYARANIVMDRQIT
jgi:ribosomal protein S18 acetylase RimI-like enzyme